MSFIGSQTSVVRRRTTGSEFGFGVLVLAATLAVSVATWYGLKALGL